GGVLRLGRLFVHHRCRVRYLRRAGDLLTGTAQDLAHEQRRQRLIGIGLMVATTVVFAALDATAKYLGTRMPTLQVVGVRCAPAFLIGFIFFNPFTRPGLMKTARPGLQIGRASMLLGSTVFNFMAFRWLQLDEAMAILFSTPFLIAIFAGPMLGEWVG